MTLASRGTTLLVGMLVLGSCSMPAARPSDSMAQPDQEGRVGVSARLVTWLELRERSWALDSWGLTRGGSLTVRCESVADGRRRDGSLAAQATVKVLSDEGSDRTWTKPTGTILVSTDDWSKLHDAGATPLILEVRLHDDPMTADSCFHAVVELPK